MHRSSAGQEKKNQVTKVKKPAAINCYRLFLLLRPNEIHVRMFSSESQVFRDKS